tara:strand:+ start:2558 stop:2752 length:195 start_codon:yes stop_codon:yes gene_type:complete
MPTNIRLKLKEQSALQAKCGEVNRKLVAVGQQPVKYSELTHVVLGQAIERLDVSGNGQIVVRSR